MLRPSGVGLGRTGVPEEAEPGVLQAGLSSLQAIEPGAREAV
jgi:hypothetical protein